MSSLVPSDWTTTKPASQRAATMTIEPKAEDVDTFMTVVGASKEAAVRWLKVKQGNLEAAMNAVFEGESLEKLEEGTTWDGGLFDADRNGNTDLHPLGASAAPTRGPSPAPSGIEAPKNKAAEDEEFARAIAASQGDAGTISYNFGPQENGSIGADGKEQNFGPATKKEYEERQWGVTLYSSIESVPDASIQDRIQDLDDALAPPRFLKHLPDGDYTPNLLTICHAIPKARAAFLAESLDNFSRDDYGHDSDWWKGSAIRLPRVVTLDNNDAVNPDGDPFEEFIAELQRLTAFLNGSRRVYASIRGLTETEVLKNSSLDAVKSCTLVELVMETWTKAVKSRAKPEDVEQITRLFTTVIGTTAKEGMSTPNLILADLTAKCADDVPEELRPELPELLDDLLWDTEPQDTSNDDNYIESPADIVVMRLRQTNTRATRLNVKVPPYLDLGKYLKENVAATRATRQHMIQGKRRIAKIGEIERKLRVWRHSQDYTEIDASQLLKYTVGHFSGQNRRDADQADKSNNASLADDQPAYYCDISRKLHAVVASIDAKLETLAREKEKIRKTVSALSKASPERSEAGTPQRRYTLRGVATKPNITYVLKQKNQQELDSASAEADQVMAGMSAGADSTPAGMQWWRLAYEISGNEVGITRSRADDYDVIRAVELEHHTALLVYANEDANDADTYDMHSDLPEGLKKFIKHDNIMFKKDIERSQREPPSYQSQFDTNEIDEWNAVRTIERKGSSDSMNVQHDEMFDSCTLNDFDDQDPNQHQVSLGYMSRNEGAVSPPAVDIHLDSPHHTSEDFISGDVEMAERAHPPLIPKQQTVIQCSKSEAYVGGMEGQDIEAKKGG